MEKGQDITRLPLFFWVLNRYRGYQIVSIVLILFTIFMRVFPLEMQKKIINLAIGMKSISNLVFYCVLYIAAVILAGLLKYAVNVITNFVGQKILYEIRTALFDHILRLPLSFFRKTPPGMVISFIISELGNIGEFMGEAIATPLVNILSLVALAGYMFYLNPLLALVSICVYPLQVVIIPLLQSKFNKLNQERMNITRNASNFLGEVISGVHEIHCNASYEIEGARFEKFVFSLFGVRYRMAMVKFLIKWANNFFQNLGPFILFLLGGFLAIKGRLDIGALVAFLSAYEKLSDPWKELIEYYQNYQDAKVRYRKVMEAFSYASDTKVLPTDRKVYSLVGNIEMENLGFAVDGSIKIVDSVSLSVKAGERVAIVGFSGSGKSTLILLLAQLYSHTEGNVLLDGHDLKKLTKSDISFNIGYVAQSPFVFSGTILENLLYGCNAVKALVAKAVTPENTVRCRALNGYRSELIDVIKNVGLEDDILMFGLNSRLEKTEEDLANLVLSIRRRFLEGHDPEVTPLIEFFDEHSFLSYQSIAVNLTFGFSLADEPEEEILMKHPRVLETLDKLGLLVPLALVGRSIVTTTMDIFKEEIRDEFFAKITPLSVDEFPLYRHLAEDVGNIRKLKRRDLTLLVKLALRYVPAHHPIISLPAPFTDYIVKCRAPFREFLNESLRDSFCFINQNQICWKHSVFQNIIFGNIKSDIAHAEETVRTAVLSIIEEEGSKDRIMLKGLDYHVGTQGSLLSGGQKQKLCLARVLLKRPSILLLDEITSGLDNRSQMKVQQLIKEHLAGKCTILSVVHRLETVKDYDRIVVMKAGRIVEVGTYEELIERKGDFYALLRGF